MKMNLQVKPKIHIVTLFVSLTLLLGVACNKFGVNPPALRNFKQINLVANKSKYGPVTVDPTLINGFGMAWSPNGVAWVNSVGGHVSEVYSADGAIARANVHIPSRLDTTSGLPTGIVFSGGAGFKLSNGPAAFLFSGFDGVLSGWNGASNNTAKKILSPETASFTGLTIAKRGNSTFLYAANFGQKKINVWDTTFARVTMPFTDPSLPEGFSPYNIQAIGNDLYILYGQLGSNGLPVAGEGKGIVSVFSSDGTFIRRFATQGALNVPWGITETPEGFLDGEDVEDGNGGYETAYAGEKTNSREHVILIGNFGDGRINAYSREGKFIGQLKSNKRAIVIDGLWALSFAPASSSIDSHRLYFTAGPEHETDGLFGYLIKE